MNLYMNYWETFSLTPTLLRVRVRPVRSTVPGTSDVSVTESFELLYTVEVY